MPVDMTEEQLSALLEFYSKDKRPNGRARDILAEQTGLRRGEIAVWFANRRIKEKNNMAPPSSAVPRKQCIVDYVKNNPLPKCKDVRLHENNYNEDDDKLAEVIRADENLKRYFGTRTPDLICGARYRALSYIGEGSYGVVLLARDIYTSENVIVKIPLASNDDDGYIRDMLKEFMYQEKAHNLLKGTKCAAPQPKGFIRIVDNTVPLGYTYLSVSEFIPIVEDARCTLSIYDAMETHVKGNPVLKKEEWKNVLLALIDATETLQKNDIYHNDIKSDNVMLYFDENNKPSPVLIDFGLSSTKKSLNREIYKQHRLKINIFDNYNAPELFLELKPSATSDVYSVARMIQNIGHHLDFSEVKGIALCYCQDSYRERQSHSKFRRMVDDAFEGRVNVVHSMEHHRIIYRVKVPSPALAPAPVPVPAPAPAPAMAQKDEAEAAVANLLAFY